MPSLPAQSSGHIPNGTSYPHHQRAKSASEAQIDEARITFNKAIDGHYRHGKTGYGKVGALFLTWKDDDMHCKTTEVTKLHDLFKNEFHFTTECFEIPSERWETALHRKLADFCWKYDSAEDLAIVYYGGHAYEGTETKQFKLAAKFTNDGLGDPTAFFNDIRTCLRLPKCDQLVILDCCFAARAFARDDVGKRKFELLTSSAHNLRSPAPHLEHSFTRTLYEAMKRLLEQNPKGFSTSHLYREVYHTIPVTDPSGKTGPKPLLFDQARHSLGRIWIRPQIPGNKLPDAPEEGGYLKLTFRLNERPDLAVMNELALHLQFLPHVDQIRFEDLYAPTQQVKDFMRLVYLASKLKPVVGRLHAKRQRRKLQAIEEQKKRKPPASFVDLHLESHHRPAYDWSSAEQDHDHKPEATQASQENKKKSRTWPPLQKAPSHNSTRRDEDLSSTNNTDSFSTELRTTGFTPRFTKAADHFVHDHSLQMEPRLDIGNMATNTDRPAVSPSIWMSEDPIDNIDHDSRKRHSDATSGLEGPPGKIHKLGP